MDLETPRKAGRPAFPGGPARTRRPELGGRGVTRARTPIHGPTPDSQYAFLFAYLFHSPAKCPAGLNVSGRAASSALGPKALGTERLG